MFSMSKTIRKHARYFCNKLGVQCSIPFCGCVLTNVCIHVHIWILNQLDCGESELRVMHLSHHHQSLEPVTMYQHQI